MAAARTVYLVRHGEAAASWETAVDPGLSVAGQQQAQALLDTFGATPPRRLVSSPLQRAQETAAPLAALLLGYAAYAPVLGMLALLLRCGI
jgi:broad specificity phosphatase PhoE